MNESELASLVKQKIDNLRPKLLDLSRRNPLIATKLGPRSNSHIRVVDELPDILFFKLNNGQQMRLVPLPAIDDDPRDEQTSAFRDALVNARLTDEQYLVEMEAVPRDADDYIDRTRRIERALKDRIRIALGLPPRTKKTEINLVQHAKINGITPSYELPTPETEHADGRHTDDDIQTLLLPSDLERKLNAIVSKCRTWVQETGINVLHVAYGFLEWSDGIQTETSFAPLILGEAQIEKRRTSEGVEFSIVGTGEDPLINAVLAEMLRLNFGVELPEFDTSSIEAYLAKVAELSPKKMIWRVRRQVAIGVFPSARMAMYYDLDPNKPPFPENEIVRSLLGGSESETALPFVDEYEVDHPDVERKVPCLVMEADSSQFSALVDLADGKNVAVEGPPGTGKSQMIVNAIAAALADGKKVLFVAEKLAALNVVKSRLEAVGLAEFLLPLQADRSTREQVIASIRDRMEMRNESPVRDLDTKLAEYRQARQQIARYIELMTQSIGDTDLTVHKILGKSLTTNACLEDISPETLEQVKVPERFLTASGIDCLRKLGATIENAHREASASNGSWRGTGLLHPDRFTVEEVCSLADRASKAFDRLAYARERLADAGLPGDVKSSELSALKVDLANAQHHAKSCGMDVVINLLNGQGAETAKQFIERCASWQRQRTDLSNMLAVEPGVECLELISRTAEACERFRLSTVDPERLTEDLADRKKSLETARAISATLTPLVDNHPDGRSWTFGDIAKAHVLVKEAKRDSLLCRNMVTSEPDSISLLEILCAEGRQLRDQKAALSGRVSFTIETPTETLSECLSILRIAGAFSFLSPRYRRAKRLFRSISSGGKYTRQEAIVTLEALIGFQRREADYVQHSQASVAFGHRFKGIDTDFGVFDRLVSFYRGIDDQFGQPDKKTLRQFLRGSDLTILELLPAIPPTNVDITYDSLQDRIRDTESKISELKDAISSLSSCVHVFAQPKSIGPAGVRRLVQQVQATIEEEATLDQSLDVKRIIGEAFNGARTQSNLEPVIDWAISAQRTRKSLRSFMSAGTADDVGERIEEVLEAEAFADELLERVSKTARIDSRHFTHGCSLRETGERLARSAQDPDGLFRYAVLAAALEDVRPHGVFKLVEERLGRQESVEGLASQFEAVAIRQLAKTVYAATGTELTRFRGGRLDMYRATIAKLDREIIELSRKQLRVKVQDSAHPPRGNGIGRKSTWTEMALIENETSKKQRFISVRELTQRAGRALQELKPCWMMSPLAVAQYVPRESVTFDLCIIDEASQMPPESAIGGLLRCKQTVVVGDTNQLPPTSFFKTVVDEEDADEDETVLNESILEMANATFRPARRLRWHYRSRHSGLIKFSNHLVYDNDLIVFPSATELMSKMGVELRRAGGWYKAGTNPIEAKAVVEAALEFMRTDPNRSLGIVTFNQKQRDLISEEFEYAIEKNDTALQYIESWKERNDGLEEFFIKNLENVQGDERDVIFIGTVYGAEEQGGRVMQRFGPINGIAGKRRLNVLFTRAKQKIVTFSSMTASDIMADEYGNPGAYMLKRWLEYSASGILEGGERTPREPDSDFEIFVINQIRSMGCEPVPQVGVAGYFVDIGVKHAEWPYGFVLGVECDGASYHSAKSARDRDRLRQEVLEKLGWRLHRIWSTDWFNSPQREAEELRKAIVSRLDELKQREWEYKAGASHQLGGSVASEPEEAVVLPLFSGKKPSTPPQADSTQDKSVQNKARVISVGDTVRVRYLTDDKKTLHFTISGTKSDPSKGIVYQNTPIAKALLGAEEGEEVEVLVGSYVRPAVVERIMKDAS